MNRGISPAPSFAVENTEMADVPGNQPQKTGNSAGLHVVIIARAPRHHSIASNPRPPRIEDTTYETLPSPTWPTLSRHPARHGSGSGRMLRHPASESAGPASGSDADRAHP
ncbi:hypothetical protein GCM10007382_10920 [Salinibacterium xinjiangense]|nr:hypothetical protein GCM10007382_10920 [Salinibacterium xinjiangense]